MRLQQYDKPESYLRQEHGVENEADLQRAFETLKAQRKLIDEQLYDLTAAVLQLGAPWFGKGEMA